MKNPNSILSSQIVQLSVKYKKIVEENYQKYTVTKIADILEEQILEDKIMNQN